MRTTSMLSFRTKATSWSMKARWASSMPTPWKDRPKCQSEVCNNRIFLRYRLPPTLLRHHPGGVTEVKSGRQWLLPAPAVEEAAGLIVAGGCGRSRSGGGGDFGQLSVIEAGAIHIGFRELSFGLGRGLSVGLASGRGSGRVT